MEDDLVEGGVTVMAVGEPVFCEEVDLYVAEAQGSIELNLSFSEIRAFLEIPAPGIDNVQGLSRDCFQGVFFEEVLPLPDFLNESFGNGEGAVESLNFSDCRVRGRVSVSARDGLHVGEGPILDSILRRLTTGDGLCVQGALGAVSTQC